MSRVKSRPRHSNPPKGTGSMYLGVLHRDRRNPAARVVRSLTGLAPLERPGRPGVEFAEHLARGEVDLDPLAGQAPRVQAPDVELEAVRNLVQAPLREWWRELTVTLVDREDSPQQLLGGRY